MTTFLFFHTDGTITQTSNDNPQAAYNHLVNLGLVDSTSEFTSVFEGNMMGDISVIGSDLKNQIEDWQSEYPN